MHGVTLPGFRLMGWQRQKKYFKLYIRPILLSIHKKQIQLQIDSDREGLSNDKFSPLPTLPFRLIICFILIIKPADHIGLQFNSLFYISFAATLLKVAAKKCISCLCANLATINVAVGCANFAVRGQNEEFMFQKYQFSSNMFPLPTTLTMFDS